MGEPKQTITAEQMEQVLRCVEGELSDAEERALLDLAERDPAVGAALAAQRALDERVRGAFVVPSSAPALDLPAVRSSAPARWRALAIAAVVLLALGVGGQVGLSRYAAWAQRLDAGDLYARMTVRFVPEVVCDTPEKFAAYTRDAFGASIVPGDAPGVTLVGWNSLHAAYGDQGEARPRVLLAEVEGRRVVVLFQPSGGWTPDEPGDGLTMFSRRVGSLRAHEITPLEDPGVLGLLGGE